MKHAKKLLALLAVGAMALSLAGCGGSSSARPLTLGKPDGPQTNNSNPFLGTSAATVQGYRFVIYETPVIINDTDPTEKPIPRLASAFEWNKDYTEITYTVRKGVKWSDGKPLTAKDFAFSYQLQKDNEALNTGGLPFKDIKVDGDKVTVSFETNQFVHQSGILQTIIVPEHIWSKVGDPTKYTNKKPVGTGPYILKNWSTQGVTLTANENYWGGKPKVPTLRYKEYNDNTALINAMNAGEVDHGFVFIPDYKNAWLGKNKHHKSYYPSGIANVSLWINNAKGAFSNVAFRKAASMVIDREALSKQGTSGAAPTIKSVTGIPEVGKSFVIDKYKGQEFKVDVEGAKKVLTDAGYTGVGEKNGLKDPSGKAVELMLTDPAGWSDYDTELQLIGSDISQLGAKVTVQNPSYDTWNSQLAKGDFDGALHWSDTGLTPYDIYKDAFGEEYYKPLGEDAYYNFGRVNNPEVNKAIHEFANADSDGARNKALEVMQTFQVEQVPIIPVLEVPTWGNYSDEHFTGWPDENNHYANINLTMASEAYVMMHLSPVKK